MIPRSFPLLLAASLFMAGGCEETGLDTTDFPANPPDVAAPGVSPGTVDIDALTPSGTTYTFDLTLSVKAFDPNGQGDLAAVRAEAFRPGSGSSFVQASLHDDGASPDAIAGDSVYSGTLTIRTERSEAGLYRVRFVAQDRAGLRSRGLEGVCAVTRNNAPPSLIAESLAAPDTVTRPPSGTLLFRVSIAAEDSDGLADIQRVFLENLATLTRFTLLDDGGVQQPNGVTSGDSLAGDGVFSITFGLPSTAPAGTLQYRLQAVDAALDTSNSIPYTLVVQ
jgi:hypothetical protein